MPDTVDPITTAQAALAALPASPSGIATALHNLGLRGPRRAPARCPMAAYLRLALEAAGHGACGVTTDRAVTEIAMPGGGRAALAHSIAAYDFVTMFDAGAYPDLEADPE
jgi:hypothetical protein